MGDNEKILVKDLFDVDLSHSLIVTEDERLEDVIKRYSRHSQHLGIFVVRQNKMFHGMITVGDLLSFISLRIGKEASYTESVWDILRVSQSCVVKDLIQSNSESDCVKPDDDVLEAIRLMRERNLIDLPVIDEKRRIVGHLNLPEMFRRISKKHIC